MTSEQAIKLLDETLARIGEHFDAVQIHASWITDDGEGASYCVHRGTGNFYARRGMVQEFIELGQHQDLAEKIARESEG